jgi:hypothetical protein
MQAHRTRSGLALPDAGRALVRHDGGVEVGVAAAEIGFQIIQAGVAQAMQGDIKLNAPSGDIGVRVDSGRPSWLRSGTHTSSLEVFRYRSSAPAGEAVNVKLQAQVQYNGLEVSCSFGIPADGNRSRWGTDTTININNPLSLLELDTPAEWQAIGIMKYPVVFVPISIFVDEPWPNDNYKVSFNLTISGMYGFGAHGYNIKESYVEWTD